MVQVMVIVMVLMIVKDRLHVERIIVHGKVRTTLVRQGVRMTAAGQVCEQPQVLCGVIQPEICGKSRIFCLKNKI